MYSELSHGDATKIAESELWGIDSIDEIDDEAENVPDFFELNDKYFSKFFDHVYNGTIRCGYSGRSNDVNELSNFIFKRAEAMGGNLSRATIRNWLSKSPPDGRGRDNVYQLCFALAFNVKQTKEFFVKAYLERPFNFRQPNECIYYFSLKTGKTYQDALILRDRLDIAMRSSCADSLIDSTLQIGATIKDFEDEDDFVRYMADHRDSFTFNNVAGQHKVISLLDECRSLANLLIEEGYYQSDDIDAQIAQVRSDENLLTKIYGFHARKQKTATIVDEETGDQIKIKNNYKGYKFSFPQYIKRNFPTFIQLQEVRAGSASYDTIRKALILLCFYRFFAISRLNELREANDGGCNYYDDFRAETCQILVECGYGELYVRNPYDWMFCYCATKDNPLEELRACVEKYWTKKDEK